jgi:hypothetical protein
LLRVAVGEDQLAGRDAVALDTMAGEQFQVWPREMAPEHYDAVGG